LHERKAGLGILSVVKSGDEKGVLFFVVLPEEVFNVSLLLNYYPKPFR
jgi:hypothetical protein